jgi:hypothetical protein
MKRLNGCRIRFVLVGFVAAVVLAAGGRAKADFTFGKPVNLGSVVNDSGNDQLTDISADGLELYFISQSRPGGQGSWDIWVSTRQTKGNRGSSLNYQLFAAYVMHREFGGAGSTLLVRHSSGELHPLSPGIWRSPPARGQVWANSMTEEPHEQTLPIQPLIIDDLRLNPCLIRGCLRSRKKPLHRLDFI